MHLSDQLFVSGPTTRKYRPLPPQPSQQQSHDYTAYSGDYYRNRISGVSGLSSTPTGSRRSNGSSSKAALQRNNIVGVHTLSESENILDHIPSPNGILSPAIFLEVTKLINQAALQTKPSSKVNGKDLASLAKGAMVKSIGLLMLPLGTFSL